MVFLQQLLNGLANGMGYVLIAVGLTLVFGVLRVVNFAHGEFFMLGGTHDDGVVLDEFLAEQDFREVNRILRAIRMGDGAHIGFVGIAHMRINHFEVALVDGKIDRLADRAAGMVH